MFLAGKIKFLLGNVGLYYSLYWINICFFLRVSHENSPRKEQQESGRISILDKNNKI